MRDLSPGRWLNGVLALLFVVCAVAPSCAPPDFNFTGKDPDTELPQHCRNQILDQGETDVDCGAECDPCALGQLCASTGDCLEGECIDGYCQDAGCSDGAVSGDESDVDCGGPACKPCSPNALCREASDCDSAVCTDGTCAPPACNDLVFNGDESDIDCGGSCDQCPPGRVCRDGEDCIGDVCGLDNRCIVVCVEGRADCDLDAENSCEVNLNTDPENCGECGADCALDHANADCSGGECIVASCKEPYLDCNGDPEDGCEVNGGTDVTNCGTCEKVCPAAQGTALCIDGECDIDCDAGFDDCDGNAANGCEKSVLGDVNNCNGCGKICPTEPGETPWCVEGICGGTPCPDGFGDCNGKPEDGCEVDLRSNVDHCNTCGNFCAALNGTAACDERVCIVQSCDPGHADCNEAYVDGCEVDTETDVQNCGECENECAIANATPECEGGECQVKTCSGSYRDCDGNDTDCEVNIATDADHCGGCVAPAGHDCSDDFASRHANGVCVDEVCGPGTCYEDYANCNTTASDGCEAALETDDNHCGNCSTVCQDTNAANSCSNGACVATCNTNYLSCDGNSANGCEVNRLTNTNNCGACNTVCQNTNATPVCSNGSCTPSCNTNYLSCDGNGNNGCEVDKRTNDKHCNTCNNECLDVGGTNTCAASVCVPVCDGTHGDCDSSRPNGCEADLTTDEANCGACGTDCVSGSAVHAANGSTCVGGTCDPACDDGWGACSNPENGCLTKLDTAAHCGDCDISCTGGTPFCVNESCAARLPIVLENSMATASTLSCSNSCSDFKLSLTHTVQKPAGSYRLIVIAVATSGQDQSRATPDSVSYGAAVNLTLVRGTWAGNRGWAGIYVVKDSQLPSSANTASTVTIAFGSVDGASRATAAIYEFSGVEQGTPIVAQAGTARGNCSSTPPSDAVSIATAGSHLVSVAALFGQTSATPNGTPLALVERMDLNGSEFTGLSGQVQSVSAGSYTVGWTPGSCNNSAHVVVALDPAKTP